MCINVLKKWEETNYIKLLRIKKTLKQYEEIRRGYIG